MPNPIIIFESHLDRRSKILLHRFLLTALKQFGYDTLCLEISNQGAEKIEKNLLVFLKEAQKKQEQGLKLQETAKQYLAKNGIAYKENLSELPLVTLIPLMLQYVSSTQPGCVARTIKDTAVFNDYNQLLIEAKKQQFKVEGIDVDTSLYSSSLDGVISPLPTLYTEEDRRIKNFCQNIYRLYKQGKGIIFLCGYSHADALMKALARIKDIPPVQCYTIISPEILGYNYNDPILTESVTNPLNKKMTLTKDGEIPHIAKVIFQDVELVSKKQDKQLKRSNIGQSTSDTSHRSSDSSQAVPKSPVSRVPSIGAAIKLKYCMWGIELPKLIDTVNEKDINRTYI